MKALLIRRFLSSLSDLDYRYLTIQLSMAKDARTIIQEFNLSKEEFCKLLEISPREYTKYINGGFNYDIRKMALMQAAYVKLKSEQAAKEAKKKLTKINTQE
jgi:transcriptional regulator with XRE-family HTH domain